MPFWTAWRRSVRRSRRQWRSASVPDAPRPEAPMNAIEQRALAWVAHHQDDVVALLQRLVAIPSIVGAEGACQALVAQLMGGCCDAVDVWEPDQAWLDRHPAYFHAGTAFADRPNVVGTLRGHGGGRSLILNAHVDVLDPGPPEAWTHC